MSDFLEDLKEDIVETIWGFGWHFIVWYVVITLLFFLSTYLLFQRFTLESILYTVLIWLVGKYLFNFPVGNMFSHETPLNMKQSDVEIRTE